MQKDLIGKNPVIQRKPQAGFISILVVARHPISVWVSNMDRSGRNSSYSEEETAEYAIKEAKIMGLPSPDQDRHARTRTDLFRQIEADFASD